MSSGKPSSTMEFRALTRLFGECIAVEIVDWCFSLNQPFREIEILQLSQAAAGPLR
jgi:hypothetical protein